MTTRGSAKWAVVLLAALVGVVGPFAPAVASSLTTPLQAATPPPRFESIGAGVIPRDVVATVVQDQLGFLWIATGNGLVRYDGHEFRTHELDSQVPAKRSLGWVRALLPGRDGRLWIGTETQGLAGFDPVDGRVRLHDDQGSRRTGAAQGATAQIQALAEDTNGAVWTGYRGEGLSRYDPRTQHRSRYRASALPGSLPDDRVEALEVSRQGTLWVGTWQGLSRRAADSDRFEPAFSSGPGSLAGRTVTALFEAADGRVWAGTQQGDLALVDPASGQGRMIVQGGSRNGGGAVSSLAQAPDGTLWVGRATGITLHSPHDGRLLRTLSHDPTDAGGLAANEVTSLWLDRTGWIWVSGIGIGLQRHDPNNHSIAVHGLSERAGLPPRGSNVRALMHLDDGHTWVSTTTGGVKVLDRQLRTIGSVAWPQARAGRPPGIAAAGPDGDTVVAMTPGAGGSRWLASDATLLQVDRGGRPLRSLLHGVGAIHFLRAGPEGNLWVGTHDGLFQWRAGSTALARVARPDGSPLRGDVYAMAESAEGGIWVGSVNGLFRIAPGRAELQPVAAAPGHELASPVVIGLLSDSRGHLWIDTAVAGLHRLTAWDGRQARFDRISARHGFAGQPYGVNLLEDARGRIWTHMHVYDPKADRIDSLTPVDGARLGNGRFGAYAKAADGRLLFGGTKGLMVVHAEVFDRSADAPPLVVSVLRVNGEPRQIGPLSQDLVFGAGERSFAVEFAALDYRDPKRVRYSYRMEGFDPDWISTGADLRVASYSNLPPGHYTLRVRATNSSGQWSPKELALAVQVQPAWWQTLPVRLAALTLLLAAAVSAWRLRVRALQHRQAQLESQVRERTAALQAMSQELQARSAAPEASSLTDPLTGLRNRRFLAERMEADVAQSIRRHEAHQQHGAPLSDEADLTFFLVDIDHFKRVNDEHGHAAGDAVLMQIRDRLQQVFRPSDHLVRWGGEEFLVVAVGSSRAGAAELAERVRATVAQQPFLLDDGSELDLACSIGFACFPLAPAHPRALGWPELVNLADAALYRAKAAGRNGWVGLVSAEAPTAPALQAAVRGSIDDWEATGLLSAVQSHGVAAQAVPVPGFGRQ